MQMSHPSPRFQQRITPHHCLNRQVERNMKDLAVRITTERLDESDIVVNMLEHIDAQEGVEVNVLVQHVRVDKMHTFALAASRQRERLLRHLIADERTFGQVSLEL